MIQYQIMQRSYRLPFVQFVKKARKPLQLAIEDAVEEVCAAPVIGARKLGGLAHIRVYKFKFQRQEYLIAYETIDDFGKDVCLSIVFYQIGPHENFYEDLKRYSKQTEN